QRFDGRVVDGQWSQVVGTNGARDTATVLAINRETLAFCRDSGERCIDVAGEVGLLPGDYYDAVHMTPSGSARVAAALAPALAPILCPANQTPSDLRAIPPPAAPR